MENTDFIKKNGSFDYDLWLSDRIKENTIKKENNCLNKWKNGLNLNKKRKRKWIEILWY